MKKLLYDQMNIRDIMNPIQTRDLLYGDEETTTNIKEFNFNNESFFELKDIVGVDTFKNEYVVISIDKTKNKIYLKEIPMD